LIQTLKFKKAESINDYVRYLAELRGIRGEMISLKELRYADIGTIEKYEAELQTFAQDTANGAVTFLLQPNALAPYEKKVKEINTTIEGIAKVIEADATDKEIA